MLSGMGKKSIHFLGHNMQIVSFFVVLAMLSLGALIAPQSASADDGVGSVLVNEDFTGSSVQDSHWLPFGGACLTAATTSPQAGQSTLGACSKTQDTGYLTGQSNGFLQLTDNSGGTASDVLFNRAVPSREGLDISFYQYQFHTSGAGLGGADGIGFFLTDGSYTLDKTGPSGSGYGGALGYASIENQSGVNNGVLGLGLDVYGNYAAQPYVGTSCTSPSTQRTPNSVALRGAGNGTSGYCLQQNSNGSYSSSSSLLETQPPVAGQSGSNNGTLVRVVISPTSDAEPNPTVTVYLNGVVNSTYTLTTPLPSTVKFGFASSTGGGHEAHLLRTVTVKSVKALNALNLVKTVNHDTTNGGTTQTVFKAGDMVPYSFLVTNTGDETLRNIAVSDPKINGQSSNGTISCAEPQGGLTPANSMTCKGSYGPLTADEAAAGSFDNTATATGQDTSDNTVTSNESSATVPTYTTGDVSVEKRVTGNAASAVDPSQEYTVNYSYPAGSYQYCAANGEARSSDSDATYAAGSGRLTVKADGTAVSSQQIPTGARVSFTEEKPADTAALNWADPSFSPNEVTVGCQNATTKLTLTNTATQVPGSVGWSKIDSSSAGLLAGSEWTITSSDGSKTSVVDNGANDSDATAGSIKVSGLAWGRYSLVETKSPQGYLLDSKPVAFTVSAQDLSVELGNIGNTKGAAGLHVEKTSDVKASASVRRGDTITYTVTGSNTGNLDLDPATIVDDLSKALGNAAYVKGSAKATIAGTQTGEITQEGSKLTWTGPLKTGQSVTITYKVAVSDKAANGAAITNMVSGEGTPPEGFDPPTSNCTVEKQSTTPECTTTVKVKVPSTPHTTSSTPPTSTSSTPKSPTGSTVAEKKLARTGADIAAVVVAVLVMLGAGLGITALNRRSSARKG